MLNYQRWFMDTSWVTVPGQERGQEKSLTPKHVNSLIGEI